MKLYIGVPTRGHVTPHFFESLMRFMVSEEAKRHNIIFDMVHQVSNLADARNAMLGLALEYDYDKLLFLDDDLLFRTEDVAKLLATDGDVVAGHYFRKVQAERLCAHYRLRDVGREPVSRDEATGRLTGMACVGMGFTTIDLRTTAKILASLETYKHSRCLMPIPAAFEFKFDTDLAGKKRLMGEDEIFCKHVLLGGGRVWMHEDIHVGHVGSFVYR